MKGEGSLFCGGKEERMDRRREGKGGKDEEIRKSHQGEKKNITDRKSEREKEGVTDGWEERVEERKWRWKKGKDGT